MPIVVVVFYWLDSIETGPHAEYLSLVDSDSKAAQLQFGNGIYFVPLPIEPGIYSGPWIVHEYRSLLFRSKSYRLFEPAEPRALWEHHLMRGEYAFTEKHYDRAQTPFSEVLTIQTI